MSDKADRFRRQGVQLLWTGALDLVVASALFLLTANRPGLLGADWLVVACWIAAAAIGALGAFMMIGGSLLIVTADRSPFPRRRSSGR